MLARVLLMIAVATSMAYAQPAPDAPPPPPDTSPPPPQEPPPVVQATVDAQVQLNVEAVFDKLAADAPLIQRLAKGTFRRARRAISIGPTVGAYAGLFPDAEQSDVAITFGLGLEVFKVPVLPTPATLKAIAIERAKARLKEGRIGDAESFAREVWNDVVEEMVGMEGVPGKRIEKPRLSLALEGNRLLDSEAWLVRFRGGIGISKVTLAASFAAAFTDPETSIYAGLEVVLHVMASKRPRASVIDLFVRGDFELRNRDVANADFYGAGVRYLLDVL